VEVIDQRGLVAKQNTELEQHDVAAADLGEADELSAVDDDLMRRKDRVAGRQETPRDRVVSEAQLGHVLAGSGDLDAARPRQVECAEEQVAKPAVGLGDVACEPRDWHRDGTAQHVLVEEHGSAPGTSFEDLHAGALAAVCVDHGGQAMVQSHADDDGWRRGGPDSESGRLQQGLVRADRRGGRFGW
jgi:hypothetical protein